VVVRRDAGAGNTGNKEKECSVEVEVEKLGVPA
jgi:hypothetical protein